MTSLLAVTNVMENGQCSFRNGKSRKRIFFTFALQSPLVVLTGPTV